MTNAHNKKPCLLVLASTYPRWANDPEPAFIHHLNQHLGSTFQVHVICPHSSGALGQEIMDGIHVHRFRYAPSRWESLVHNGGIINNLKHHPVKWLLVPLFFGGLTLKTWELINTLRPDCLHAHWIIPQGFVLAALSYFQRSPVPFLLTSHGGDLFGLQGKIMAGIKRWIIRRCSALTVVSQPMVSEAIKLGATSSNTHVIPMGIDFNRFTLAPQTQRSTNEILFVGRLVEKKGLQYLIKALPKVLEQFPTAYLTVAGFGPEEQALKLLTHHLGIAHHVNFLGAVSQSELPSLYQRAAVFVAPFVRAESGDQDGFPVTLLEAIACGCPVIVGDLPVFNDILDMTEYECKVNIYQSGQLTEQINNVLSNRNRAEKKVLIIRHRLEMYLNWNYVGNNYSKLLNNIIKNVVYK